MPKQFETIKGIKYEGLPIMDSVEVELTADPKIIRQQLRSKGKYSEAQRGKFKEYILAAKWSKDERKIFNLLTKGAISVESLRDIVGSDFLGKNGMSDQRIVKAIEGMRKKRVLREVG